MLTVPCKIQVGHLISVFSLSAGLNVTKEFVGVHVMHVPIVSHFTCLFIHP